MGTICELHTQPACHEDTVLTTYLVLSSDYRSIDPRYGTLEDWDRLLKGVHDRGMKLM